MFIIHKKMSDSSRSFFDAHVDIKDFLRNLSMELLKCFNPQLDAARSVDELYEILDDLKKILALCHNEKDASPQARCCK